MANDDSITIYEMPDWKNQAESSPTILTGIEQHTCAGSAARKRHPERDAQIAIYVCMAVVHLFDAARPITVCGVSSPVLHVMSSAGPLMWKAHVLVL